MHLLAAVSFQPGLRACVMQCSLQRRDRTPLDMSASSHHRHYWCAETSPPKHKCGRPPKQEHAFCAAFPLTSIKPYLRAQLECTSLMCTRSTPQRSTPPIAATSMQHRHLMRCCNNASRYARTLTPFARSALNQKHPEPLPKNVENYSTQVRANSEQVRSSPYPVHQTDVVQLTCC
jgi:hypothetical protein